MTSFTVDTRELGEALASVTPVIPRRPSRDVLKCVKFKAIMGQNDRLELSATDLETYVVINISSGVMVQNAGEFVVPAQVIIDYVKSLEAPTVDMTLANSGVIQISEDGAQFEVGIQDIDEFPDFPKRPTTNDDLELDVGDLFQALDRVAFAVASEGHPRWGALSAVCMELSENAITLIGTDQHRASLASISVTPGRKEQYLVNAKSLAILPKVFTEPVKLCFTNNAIIFYSDANSLYIRLMQGNFPPVRQFVPTHQNELKIDPRSFLRQVRKAALAADEHSSIKIVIKDDKIGLYAKTRIQRKLAKVEQTLEDYNGPDFEFAVNCKYLIELLKAANNNEELLMKFNKNHQPILFKQDRFDHVMVPVEVR